MYNAINKILLFAFVAMGIVSCDKWNDIENIELQLPKVGTDAYFENLREYKKSDHAVAFGWYGGWTAQGPDKSHYLASLPDSIDFISLWGAGFNYSSDQLEDLKEVQTKKGTKVLLCWICQNIGDQLEKYVTDENGQQKRTLFVNQDSADAVKYAQAILDTIYKYNLDGFDIDFEPNFGSPGTLAGPSGGSGANRKNLEIFVKELNKKIGPKSGTGKLLVIDGEPQSISAELGEYFDYFIVQAYYATSPSNYDARINSTRFLNGFSTKKYIVTEDFERYTPSSSNPGGSPQQVSAFRVPISPVDYIPGRSPAAVPALIGMAYWNPVDGRKGGVGTYHMEYDYTNSPDYKFLRRAIQIMNPAPY